MLRVGQQIAMNLLRQLRQMYEEFELMLKSWLITYRDILSEVKQML
jgi:hypothetical protein